MFHLHSGSTYVIHWLQCHLCKNLINFKVSLGNTKRLDLKNPENKGRSMKVVWNPCLKCIFKKQNGIYCHENEKMYISLIASQP